MEKKIIASYPLTNVAGIAIYEVNEDYVIAGLNNDKPRRYKVYGNTKGFFFNWGRIRIYLHECLKV